MGEQSATCDTALQGGAKAPDWVHLMPAGSFKARDGRSFSLDKPQAVLAAFREGGIDLPVDYEHANDNPEAKLRGPVRAAGWIKELRSDAGGLWGRVEWTAAAAEMIGKKEYRFISSTFLHTKTGGFSASRARPLSTTPPCT
jgi:phage I-like protein